MTISVNTPGDYTLVVTNTENGCTQDDVIEVLEDVLPPNATANTLNDMLSLLSTGNKAAANLAP